MDPYAPAQAVLSHLQTQAPNAPMGLLSSIPDQITLPTWLVVGGLLVMAYLVGGAITSPDEDEDEEDDEEDEEDTDESPAA